MLKLRRNKKYTIDMLNIDNDRLAKTLLFEKLESKYGYAKVRAAAKPEFLNGVNIAHGGFLFALADYTAALATNTESRAAISSSASINFLSPTPENAEIIATASIAAEDAKSAVCDVRLSTEGKTVAVFQSRVIFKSLGK